MIPHSCKQAIKTAAEWKSLPKGSSMFARFSLVSRLSDWVRPAPLSMGVFENDEQVRGALMLAYQQYMDGMGKSTMHWIGISESECDEWRQTGKLPKRLRVRRPRYSHAGEIQTQLDAIYARQDREQKAAKRFNARWSLRHDQSQF